MGGTWRTKPPDAESAVGARIPESAGKAPHLSGARGVGWRLLFVSCVLKTLTHFPGLADSQADRVSG
jgi:hypothetical protein